MEDEKYVPVFINVTNDGYIRALTTGRNVVPDAPYDYYFFMSEEEASNLGRARVVIDDQMKPQLQKEAE